jgi:hypothetical protein
MSDFTTLLKQSIIERGIAHAGDRATIYAEARSAMTRRLRSFDPRLGQQEIEARLEAFERAIDEMELDLAETFAALAADPRPDNRVEGQDAIGEDANAAELSTEPDEAGPPQRWHEGAGEDIADGESPRWIEPGDPYAASSEYDDTNLRQAASGYLEDRATPDAYDQFPPLDEDPEPPARIWSRFRPATERGQIQALVGVIAVLAVILGGIAAVMLWPRDITTAGGGVAVIRREVSDPAAAARIPNEPLKVAQSFVVFDGQDPTVFEGSSANPIRFDGDADGGFAIVSSSSGASGAKALIGPGLASRLAGKRIRVTLVARAARENGASGLRFAYQSGLAVSHWQSARLSDEYVPLGMIWRVPTLRTNPAGDFLLIEPGIPGDGTGAEIKSIRIDVLAS